MIIIIVINFLTEIPRESGIYIYILRVQHDLSMKECVLQSCHFPHVNSWQGEICLCTSRIFVQKSIYSEFLKRFVEATRLWKVGIPSDPSASMGALISKAHLEKVSKSLPCVSLEGSSVQGTAHIHALEHC